MLNITGTRTVIDPSFRYKMPGISVKIEGRGNGIKSVLTNIGEIANSLNRPPELLCRFIGIEIGAHAHMKETSGGGYECDNTCVAIVNGEHTVSTIQNIVNRFIELFVLCPSCRLPETALVISKPPLSTVKHRCSACGAKSSLGVAASHKLVGVIQKMALAATATATATVRS